MNQQRMGVEHTFGEGNADVSRIREMHDVLDGDVAIEKVEEEVDDGDLGKEEEVTHSETELGKGTSLDRELDLEGGREIEQLLVGAVGKDSSRVGFREALGTGLFPPEGQILWQRGKWIIEDDVELERISEAVSLQAEARQTRIDGAWFEGDTTCLGGHP